MAFSYLNDSVSSLFASLDDADNSIIKIGDHVLAPTTVSISKLSIDMLTPDLLKPFSFNNAWAVQPKQEYRARSIVVFTAIARYDTDGILAPCALSAFGARMHKTDNKHVLGESYPVVKSDIFLQADYYSLGIGDMVLPVPVHAVKAYDGSDAKRLRMSIRLTTTAPTDENAVSEYDLVRTQYQDIVRKAAIHSGIPANEQFEVCIVGFPSHTELRKNKESEFYSVSLNMGYMIGVRHIKSSGRPKTIHAVNLNHMIGGESLEQKMLKEIALLSSGSVTPAIVKATAPIAAPAPVAVVAPTPISSSVEEELDEDGMPIRVMTRTTRKRPAPVMSPVVEPAPVAEPVVTPVVEPVPVTRESLSSKMRRKATKLPVELDLTDLG